MRSVAVLFGRMLTARVHSLFFFVSDFAHSGLSLTSLTLGWRCTLPRFSSKTWEECYFLFVLLAFVDLLCGEGGLNAQAVAQRD